MSAFQETLDALLEQHGLLGISVVRRDGLPAVSAHRRSVQETSFAAMTAALWAASEAAFEQWTRQRPHEALIEAQGTAVAVAGLDDEVLLVVVAEAADQARSALASARDRILVVLKG